MLLNFLKRGYLATTPNAAGISTNLKKIKVQCQPILNKIAIVTGGASGIGYECARALLDRGCRAVTIADKDSALGEQALKSLCDEFGNNRAIFVKCDVTKSELVDWAFKNTIRAYQQVDIVVNNAGVLNDQVWENELATNVGGYLVGNLLSLQYMSTSCMGNGGVVVNIGSRMGLDPFCGCPIYSMTQASIVGLTKALGQGAQVARTGVKVMALCPGLTDTELLKGATQNAINNKFSRELKDEIQREVLQDPRNVARALIEVVESGESGSVWLVEKDECPVRLKMPTLDEIKAASLDGAEPERYSKDVEAEVEEEGKCLESAQPDGTEPVPTDYKKMGGLKINPDLLKSMSFNQKLKNRA